ncbi:hypothetical protein FQN60_015888 [Etheostoma spectabile]|nr:hypothetical protein FQN60_015888 [Etheostoma spectabile]
MRTPTLAAKSKYHLAWPLLFTPGEVMSKHLGHSYGAQQPTDWSSLPPPLAWRMVTDVQLAIFANMLGVSLFLLVVLYHYVAVNNPKKLECRWRPGLSSFQTFMVADTSLSPNGTGLMLLGDAVVSCAGGLSVDPTLLMGMRLTYGPHEVSGSKLRCEDHNAKTNIGLTLE